MPRGERGTQEARQRIRWRFSGENRRIQSSRTRRMGLESLARDNQEALARNATGMVRLRRFATGRSEGLWLLGRCKTGLFVSSGRTLSYLVVMAPTEREYVL